MQDRDIFTDVLAGTKHSISCYTNAITETSNQQLRSTWQTLRGEAEQMQYQIYKMAEQKDIIPQHLKPINRIYNLLKAH